MAFLPQSESRQNWLPRPLCCSRPFGKRKPADNLDGKKLNFFKQIPDEWESVFQLQKVFDDQYVPVPWNEARLGDLVIFTNQVGAIQHTTVYIADDILFTKNGASVYKPWVLMKLDDVKNTFWKIPN